MAKIKKISLGGEVYDCGGDTGLEVTKAQYDQTTPEQRAENIYYVKDEDAFIPPIVDTLKATYDALTEADKKNGTTYFVTDEIAEVNAENIKYGDSNVGDTLTELNSTMSKNTLGSSVTLSGTDYTCTSDGYAQIKCDNGVGNRCILKINGTNMAIAIGNGSFYEIQTIYVKKGMRLAIGGNGGYSGIFIPIV